MGCIQQNLHEGVSDGGHIGKVDGGINPDQQHAIYSFCLWVLVHVPTLTDTDQHATPADTIRCAVPVTVWSACSVIRHSSAC